MQLNKPVIVTGCHRSGTTLLGLMLDSHPQITTVDEDKFDNSKLADYMEHPDYAPCVVFKLPAEATAFRQFGVLPGLKVLWCVRDPRDQILSFRKLAYALVEGQPGVAGTIYDHGAMLEIARYLSFIDPQCGHPGVAEFRRIAAIPALERSRRDSFLMGALYWELKNMLPALYAAEGLPVHVVSYEALITRSRAVLEEVLGFLGLPWHEDVLRHHELHSGQWAGATMGDRPVDASNAGKWKAELSAEEVDIIEGYCAQGMARFGYAPSAPAGATERSAYTLIPPGGR
jgi:hypothetical protein